jgi:hypothetical protein
MKKIISIFLLIVSMGAFTKEVEVSLALQAQMKAQDQIIVSLFKKKFQYTLNLEWDKSKCLAKSSEIGLVGTCLVNGVDTIEGISVTIAASKVSNYSGTGIEEAEYSVTLVDYKL